MLMPALLMSTSTAVHQPDRLGKRGLDLHQVGDVGDDGFRNAGSPSRQLVANVFAGRGIAIEHAHARSFFQKARSRSRANSARASGDQDALVFQSSHAIPRFGVGTVYRTRVDFDLSS